LNEPDIVVAGYRYRYRYRYREQDHRRDPVLFRAPLIQNASTTPPPNLSIVFQIVEKVRMVYLPFFKLTFNQFSYTSAIQLVRFIELSINFDYTINIEKCLIIGDSILISMFQLTENTIKSLLGTIYI
jgi:hypothetical protein